MTIYDKNKKKNKWYHIEWSIWLRHQKQGRALKAECVCVVGMLLWIAVGLIIYCIANDVNVEENREEPLGSHVFSDVDPHGKLTRVFGNALAIDVVKGVDSAYAYRLEAGSDYEELLENYRMSAGPFAIAAMEATALRMLLFDEKTYGWDYAKGCMPHYGVRIQFVKDNQRVDVLFCFDCDILTVYYNGKVIGGEDFDDARPRLVELMKKIFPNDDVIQSMHLAP